MAEDLLWGLGGSVLITLLTYILFGGISIKGIVLDLFFTILVFMLSFDEDFRAGFNSIW